MDIIVLYQGLVSIMAHGVPPSHSAGKSLGVPPLSNVADSSLMRGQTILGIEPRTSGFYLIHYHFTRTHQL